MKNEELGKPGFDTPLALADCLNIDIEELEPITAPGNGWSV
jgi:hypothetical protein